MTECKLHYIYYSYESWGRGYIGKRTCSCPPEEDLNYFGSFSDKSFCPDNKIIIATFESSKDALAAEIVLHNAYEVAQNPHFANKAKQTSEWFNTEGVPKTEEHKEKIRQSNLGRKVSDDAKIRMSLAKMGNKHCVGKKNGLGNKSRLGIKLTTEQRLAKSMVSHKTKYKIEVTTPDGISMCPLNMRLFCEEHSICHSAIRRVAKGRAKHHKGWTAHLCDQSSSSSSSSSRISRS